MYFIEFIKIKKLETAYLFICAVFLFNLQKLNTILIKEGLNSRPFDLIIFDGYKPLIYFVATVFLFLIGAALIVHNFRSIVRSNLSLGEIALAIVSIIVIVIVMLLLLILIDNPILRAVLVVATASGGIFASEL